MSEDRAVEQQVQESQHQEAEPARGGWRTKIKNLLGRGSKESPRGSEDLGVGDAVGMFDALNSFLQQEPASDNEQLSRQNTDGLARRLVDLPAFQKLFPGGDSLVIAEGREVTSSFYREGEGVDHRKVSLSELNERMEEERDRLGLKTKISA